MKKLNVHIAYIAGVLLLSSTLFQSCHNDDNQTNELSYNEISDYTLGTLTNASAIKILKYKMPNVAGKQSDAKALVFFPKTAQPKDGYRVVVWQHGTVGVGDNCAPSNNALNENFKTTAELLLAKGFVILAPDYEGLGTKGIHPYLNVNSEANSVYYGVKALNEKYKSLIHGDWFSLGQSQGGQSSIAVAERGNQDIHFKGAVAAAPASNLDHIILEVAPEALKGIEAREIAGNVILEDRNSIYSYATLLTYVAFAGAGINAYDPSFDYAALFKSRVQPLVRLVSGTNGDDGECLNETRIAIKADIIAFLNEDEAHKLMDYPGLDTDRFKSDVKLKAFLDGNKIGVSKIDKPLLIIQGSADTNVPATITQQLYNTIVGLSSPNVEFLLVNGASHTEAIVAKNDELVAFIERYMPAK